MCVLINLAFSSHAAHKFVLMKTRLLAFAPDVHDCFVRWKYKEPQAKQYFPLSFKYVTFLQ